MDDIRSLHKKFLTIHSGIVREDLQKWTSLFCFMASPPYDPYSRMATMLGMMLKKRKALEYLDVYGKKGESEIGGRS